MSERNEPAIENPPGKEASAVPGIIVNVGTPKLTVAEKIASWDDPTKKFLKIWYRACSIITTGIGIFILVMFAVSSNRVDIFSKFIELSISSGRGFTIPSVILIIYVTKMINHYLLRQKVT